MRATTARPSPLPDLLTTIFAPDHGHMLTLHLPEAGLSQLTLSRGDVSCVRRS